LDLVAVRHLHGFGSTVVGGWTQSQSLIFEPQRTAVSGAAASGP